MRIAITGDRNRPGKRDYSHAFRPEAIRYAGDAGHVFAIDMGLAPAARRALILDVIRREALLGEVGFFCHGLTKKIELGFDVASAEDLAKALHEVGCARVALHACLTGRDVANGFASVLRDALVDQHGYHTTAVRVLGSTTSGHTSRNPHRRLFRNIDEAAGDDWIVEPGSPLWKRWVKRMHAADDPLRFQLVERTPEEIREELARG